MDAPETAPAANATTIPWRRNLWICVGGSFTTLVAMTMLLPFLPLYVAQLGVHDPAAIAEWSGAAYSATFLTAGMVSPLWGRLGDRYGRKLMLIRASLGMAVAMSLIGLAQNVYELVGLRLGAGFLGGYSSGSNILVASQSPREHSGWALGVLSSGVMAGSLAGPLIGGVLPPLIGIKATFILAGAVIFVTFLATAIYIREAPRPSRSERQAQPRRGWSAIPDKRPIILMYLTSAALLVAYMSIEPIITLYVAQIPGVRPGAVTVISGIVMSAAALGSMVSASPVGRLADRIGHPRVIVTCLALCGLLLIPQAFVTAAWQLVALRFLMGMALGGLLPCITSVIRHNVPEHSVGTALGYSTSAQYTGQVAGPLLGGFVGGHVGMRAVFLATCLLLLATAAGNYAMRSHAEPHAEP
jgi:MFS family permease